MSDTTEKKKIPVLDHIVNGAKAVNEWLKEHPIISMAVGISLLSMLKYRD